MKCSNCPRFTSKDTDTEPEGDLEVSEDGMVSGDVRIHNDCEECGGELEETSFTVEIDLTAAVRAHLAEHHADVLAERDKPKPKHPPKHPPIDPATVDEFARCRNCRKYWTSHVDPKSGLTVQSKKSKLKDARKAQCRDGGPFGRPTGTTFDPMPGKANGAHDAADGVELSVESEMTRTDEIKNTDRHGRPIRRARYMTRLYGVQVEATVKCETCGTDIATGSYSDAVQASGMEWIG